MMIAAVAEPILGWYKVMKRYRIGIHQSSAPRAPSPAHVDIISISTHACPHAIACD
jgi:hypothetical protein